MLDLVPDPASPLHDRGRHWAETNCNLDLWIEFLHRRGMAPEPGLAPVLAIADEGDQFSFCKYDTFDLAALYGLDLTELAVFDRMDRHVAVQTARGRLVLMEVDAFYLPDTRATSYQRDHTKTTIGVDWIDPASRRLGYFHNSGYFALEDYAEVLGLADERADRLFPYAEIAKHTRPALAGAELQETAGASLLRHLGRAPKCNPFVSYQARFADDLAMLGERGGEFFHVYAFNHFRQFGAAFELAGSLLRWMAPEEAAPLEACERIAANAKLMQFRAARACVRRRADPCETLFDELIASWDDLFGWLRRLSE